MTEREKLTVKCKIDAGKGKYGDNYYVVFFKNTEGVDYFWKTNSKNRTLSELEEGNTYYLEFNRSDSDPKMISYLKVVTESSMRSAEEIKSHISQIELMYTADNIPEFMRGVYNALNWVLNGSTDSEEEIHND